MTTRRTFLLAACAALAASVSAKAAQSTRRVAWLSAESRSSGALFIDAFRAGMKELGWVERKNFVIDEHWLDGSFQGLEQRAAKIAATSPDVIVSGFTRGHIALKAATSAIPIVMANGVDPVGAKLVASLARPAGNVTGLTNQVEDMSPKLLELLHAAVPRATRVAVLLNQQHPLTQERRISMPRAGASMGITVSIVEVVDPSKFDEIFAGMRKNGAGALAVPSDVKFRYLQDEMARAALRQKMPAIHPDDRFSEAGGFMSYSFNFQNAYRSTAAYVDKILKGARPGDLPIEQPTKFELIINHKTAKALGLKIPQDLLLRADKVIE